MIKDIATAIATVGATVATVGGLMGSIPVMLAGGALGILAIILSSFK